MSNLAVLPIIIPLLAGIVAVFFAKKTMAVRIFAQVLTLLNLAVSIGIAFYVIQYGTVTLETGGWAAPYGIILVADPLAIFLVLTTNIIATASVFYAPNSLTHKQEQFYFYTFYFLLISGVSGAFLTGDLFNLFVFFEVLLMASYGLIVLGGEKIQLRESLKYVLLNLFSSMLFVTAIAFLYSVTGTVNMAQLAERIQEVEQTGILTTIGILLFFVFATKGAIFPLYFWMPKSYIVPNSVVSALFGALLTKVGIYSIVRTFTLIFIHNPEVTHELFLWLAALTMIFGVIGALSTNNVKLIIVYNIIPAVGFMLMGIGLFNHDGLAGSVYYLLQDIIIKACLFLMVGALIYVTGTSNLKKMKGLIHHFPLLGWMFFIGGLVLAGIPPFSGFIGKLLLLQGAIQEGRYVIVIIGLLTSLLILLSIMRIFTRGFWGERTELDTGNIQPKRVRGLIIPAFGLLSVCVVLGIGAEWFIPHIETITNQLLDPEIYIDSVLKE
ncbi:multicomponent Na+:H+ antiporter subunit D [Salinibacillus kushneri]|uniref:Multicomponent Na+:H+ antiporter subunit D n=1 Tax=Salinibacillus kushneri TaxID=237682 RepID=A0A1I0G500_9BACI|nr:Na+/H+ antiporter subunit D [Salinibacillus kushneri]SET65717.1 multicomponent Na+:H+ antiporter subunit D [Salinibacillus kushneri]